MRSLIEGSANQIATSSKDTVSFLALKSSVLVLQLESAGSASVGVPFHLFNKRFYHVLAKKLLKKGTCDHVQRNG